jgi:hypothetical protein
VDFSRHLPSDGKVSAFGHTWEGHAGEFCWDSNEGTLRTPKLTCPWRALAIKDYVTNNWSKCQKTAHEPLTAYIRDDQASDVCLLNEYDITTASGNHVHGFSASQYKVVQVDGRYKVAELDLYLVRCYAQHRA